MSRRRQLFFTTMALLLFSQIFLLSSQIFLLDNGFIWNRNDSLQVEAKIVRARELEQKGPPLKIVGFWHIGGNYKRTNVTRDAFVIKQAKEILSEYLFSEEGLNSGRYQLAALNYVTRVNLTEETKSYLQVASNGIIQEILPTALLEEMKENEEYFEFPTLAELHSYCTARPENVDDVVFYMHSKTADDERISMEDYLLGKSCVACMEEETKMACGPNYKGWDSVEFRWPHFSGNFWMTRCSHVTRLNFPWDNVILHEAKQLILHQSKLNRRSCPYPPYGRYKAEFWMNNDAGRRINNPKRRCNGWLNYDYVPLDKKYGLIQPENLCTNNIEYATSYRMGPMFVGKRKVDISNSIWHIE
mmetsp:Transcript_617/g.778  ORF Transcript_617/g.778 Transcript_617/m.778 type:complete len:359 (-) Transcript_617:24-1100(-)